MKMLLGVTAINVINGVSRKTGRVSRKIRGSQKRYNRENSRMWSSIRDKPHLIMNYHVMIDVFLNTPRWNKNWKGFRPRKDVFLKKPDLVSILHSNWTGLDPQNFNAISTAITSFEMMLRLHADADVYNWWVETGYETYKRVEIKVP